MANFYLTYTGEQVQTNLDKIPIIENDIDLLQSTQSSLSAQLASSTRTVSIYNDEPVITVGKGKSDVNADLDYSTSVVEGTVQGTIGGKTLTNIVQNGNFVSTAGWVGVNATLSTASNVLSVICDGTQSLGRVYEDLKIKPSNSKIALKIKARVTSTSCTGLRLFLLDGIGGSTIGYTTLQSSPIVNQWYDLSVVLTTSTLTNNLYLMFEHNYPDAATALNKAMEVKEVLAIDLTGTGMETWTAAQIDAAIPSWFDATKSAFMGVGGRIRSVGKNLISDNSKFIAGKYYATNGNLTSNANAGYLEEYIKVKPSTTYTIGVGGVKVANWSEMIFYDSNKNYITGYHQHTNPVFTSPSNARFTRISIFTASSTFTTIQLELGSTATAYEPFKQNETFIPLSEPLRRLPNGVKDEVDLSSGVLTRRSGYTVLDGNINWLHYTYVDSNNAVNIYFANGGTYSWLYTPSLNDSVGYSNSATYESYAKTAINYITGKPLGYVSSSMNYNIAISLTTLGTDYATYNALDATGKTNLLKAYFNAHPISLYYQLATPTTSTLENFSPVETYKNGTLYVDPYLKKLIKYATASSGLSWVTPISTVDVIYKVSGTELAIVDSTLYTLSSDGKSVRIYTTSAKTVEVADNTYYWAYGQVKGAESIIPSLTASYATNTASTIADANVMGLANKKAILALDDFTTAYLLNLETRLTAGGH